ncbi:MAG: fimbrillin family protein [Bacteroidales bacterium]|nr:fimbrillin family protein [Bacteroidales bacterium]
MKIKHLNIALLALLTASCADEVTPTSQNDFLEGNEKTPIKVSALLDVQKAQTRAADKTFDNNDQIIAYFRHVTWDGSTGARTSVAADKAPLLVTFTKGSTTMTAYSGSDITPIGTGVALGMTSTNTQEASDLTADPTLYWDDFSVGAKGDATDLRTEGHYLQSYYGYCYNGGTPSSTLTESTGVLGWTVATNQSAGFKTSDLLWSYEQTPVAYSHATFGGGAEHGQIVLPYTHAMSKVTVEVICDEGFETTKNNFQNASVVLKNMNTVASLTAPTGTITAVPGDGNANVKDVTSQPIADATTPNVKYSFAALIAPTVMKEGQFLAEINNVDGNNYKVNLTDDILDTSADNDWASKLKNYNATDGGTTLPGVNYLITITIKKQEISVQALIKDWDTVSATGVGEINFATDVKTIVNDEAYGTDAHTATFDLYKKAESATGYGTKATTATWDAVNSVWTYSPTIYWQNKDDKEHFRALSGAKADDTATPANESLTMENGRDVLWGTTTKHTGKDIDDANYSYNEGDAINPRTTDVPLVFRHSMAKITISLVDELKDELDDDAKLDLTNATIQLTNLATGGTIELHEGTITPSATVTEVFSKDETSDPKRMGFYAAKENGTATAYDAELTIKDYPVIPQTIGDDARIIITLADGTRYSAQLNLCEVKDSTTPIEEWKQGTHYNYEITLSKDHITFRALIEKWNEEEGGGKATLEWD